MSLKAATDTTSDPAGVEVEVAVGVAVAVTVSVGTVVSVGTAVFVGDAVSVRTTVAVSEGSTVSVGAGSTVSVGGVSAPSFDGSSVLTSVATSVTGVSWAATAHQVLPINGMTSMIAAAIQTQRRGIVALKRIPSFRHNPLRRQKCSS
jgi:hypothetical protein